MSADSPTVVATYGNVAEAHAVRNELEAAGIPAQVTDEIAGSSLFYVGSALGGVKLVVREKDVPAARKILAELDAAGERAETDEAMDGDERQREDPDDEYDTPAVREKDAQAGRIGRAAVLGPFLCPPLLNIYSLILIAQNSDLASDADESVRRKIRWALIINFALVILMGALVVAMIVNLNS
jgi:hypothetical protein